MCGVSLLVAIITKPWLHTREQVNTRTHCLPITTYTVYPKKFAHGFCFAVLCCGYTLTDFPISIRLTSLALWQSNDCPSASKASLMNLDKYFMWIHYERLHNHNKAKHNKTVYIFLGVYCRCTYRHIHKYLYTDTYIHTYIYVYIYIYIYITDRNLSWNWYGSDD